MHIARNACLAALTALAVLVAAACGGGSGHAPSPTVAPAPSEAPRAENQAPVGFATQSSSALTTVQIARKLAPSIVRVQTETATLDVFGRVQPSQGVGTGVIVDTAGHIITNNHVITTGNRDTPADRITVTLNDQRTASATIVGRDQPTDLAVLKIDLDGLTPAAWADPGTIEVGQDVVAIGYALDLQGAPSVTRGVVSAKDRSIDEPPYTVNDALQTDAGINPGNSGGPLVNAFGEVIGINTAIVQTAQSIGFSISVGLARPTAEGLIANGKIDRAYLGVGTVDVTPAIARNFNLPVDHGIAVTLVGNNTPAAEAGIRTNDVITEIDGTAVSNNGDLLSVLARHRPGDSVSVQFYRGSQQRSVDVTLQSRPSQ